MQMFVLDASPALSAQWLCDAHVRVIGREVSMCLSSWYAKHIAHNLDELPYKAFNHPIVDEMSNKDTRIWAILYASAIFDEFSMRFHKVHASRDKFRELLFYMDYYDQINILRDKPDMDKARFTYVGIDTLPIPGRTIIRNLSINQAVNLYRHYYAVKLQDMKVPVTYTGNHKPEWLEAT